MNKKAGGRRRDEMKSWLKWEVTVAEEKKKPVDDREEEEGETTARRKHF